MGVLLILPLPSQAAGRMALVFGNSDYQEAPLANPVNDARDMAANLENAGFEVILKLNADRRTMRAAIREFEERASNSKVGLFYYAGHGIQINGRNFLIPVDADIQREYDVADEAVSADSVLLAMGYAEKRLNIAILDACRNNPYSRSFRSVNQGLARMNAPTGTIVAYATAPGELAADGEGRNGIYTQFLLQAMNQPGLSIEEVFKDVRINVKRATKGRQIPWEESSLEGTFFFKEKEKPKLTPDQPEPSTMPPAQGIITVDTRELLKVCTMHFQSNRLTRPENRNALACYQNVLDIDPGNLEAANGLDDIEQKYQAWLRMAMDKGEETEIEHYREILLQLNPETRLLVELNAEQKQSISKTTATGDKNRWQDTAKQVADDLLIEQVQAKPQKPLAVENNRWQDVAKNIADKLNFKLEQKQGPAGNPLDGSIWKLTYIVGRQRKWRLLISKKSDSRWKWEAFTIPQDYWGETIGTEFESGSVGSDYRFIKGYCVQETQGSYTLKCTHFQIINSGNTMVIFKGQNEVGRGQRIRR